MTTGKHEDERPEDLLTPLSYDLSLAPPRAPPMASAHRALLAGRNPAKDFHLSLTNNATARIVHSRSKDNIKNASVRLLHRAHEKRCRNTKPFHPHLTYTVGRDAATRRLDSWISVQTWNKLRDEGYFRSIVDTLILLGIPAMAAASPSAALQYIHLSWRIQQVQYGTHGMQVIDMIKCKQSDDSSNDAREVVVFVHGGAWGSGMPWMYRLVAQPFLGDKHVAIVGYRTYPDASVAGQVQDIHQAVIQIRKLHPTSKFIFMGHSSGAHIALLYLVHQTKKLMNGNSRSVPFKPSDTTFVGISGPYDIEHHFHYEAGRGVEEFSPMKAANGHTIESFHEHSPADQLQNLLIQGEPLQQYLPGSMLVLHGTEDSTVPFTATSELARRFKACGVHTLQEIYLAKVGHQQTVLEVMLGGVTQRKLTDWLARRVTITREGNLKSKVVISSRL